MSEQSHSPIDNLITDHMDIWSSAIKRKSSSGRGSSKKIELYGIKKLRELILELAVRGKLVAQDPNDEPASVLLERIAQEKAQLVKEGKIKKPKKLPEISEDEKPFELPEGWEWAQINELSKQVTDGVHHTPKYLENGVPFISVKDINGKTIEFDDCKYISEEQHLDINKRCNPEKGDILLCRIGTLGRATIVDTELPFSLFVSVGLLKFFQNELLPQYTHLALHSPCLLNQYEQIKAGGSHTNKLNLTDIPNLLIPIPSLSEQHCIVAKVDELMALCDQLEAQTESSLDAHQTLVTVLLDTLVNSQNAEELTENWRRISGHFDNLFTTEHSIDQLKQTILQLAVMGKLVPQDPNDEPAAKLLERIAAEKDELIKQKKIKKQKPLPPISEDEKPFELPKGWEWRRVWDIAELITSGSRDWAKYYSESGAIFVTMGNLARGDYKLRLETIRYVAPPIGGEGSRTRLIKGDLLISITGDVGNLGLIPENFGEAYINQHTCLLRFMPECLNRYFPELMRSPMARFQFDAPQRGIKNSFRLGDVGEMVIPLPPTEEQHRIVAKIDELMAICDQLKARLSEAQTTQLNLADALVEQAL